MNFNHKESAPTSGKAKAQNTSGNVLSPHATPSSDGCPDEVNRPESVTRPVSHVYSPLLGQPSDSNRGSIVCGRVGGYQCLADSNMRPVCVSEEAYRPSETEIRNGYGAIALLRLQHQGDIGIENAVAALGEQLLRLGRRWHSQKDIVFLLRRQGSNPVQDSSASSFMTAFGACSYAMDYSNPASERSLVLWSTKLNCVCGGLYVGTNEGSRNKVCFVPCSDDHALTQVVEVTDEWWKRHVSGLVDVFGQQLQGRLIVLLRVNDLDCESRSRAPKERKKLGQHWLSFLTAATAIELAVTAGPWHRAWCQRSQWTQVLAGLRPHPSINHSGATGASRSLYAVNSADRGAI